MRRSNLCWRTSKSTNQKKLIYLSTGGFNSLTGSEAASLLWENEISNIELSGGRYDVNTLDNLLDLISVCNLQVHNYFPPPKDAFVFNLASANEVILDKSLNHSFQAVDLAAKLGCEVYSFHAGFLIDPNVSDLGRKISRQNLQDRDSAITRFTEMVNEISKYAGKKEIKILLENNVISKANLNHFGTNPFLMTNHLEAVEIMNTTDKNVGLLVDVAHLKVSSTSESFCRNQYLESTAEFTCAYHLSENDGTTDSNEPVTSDSWFWPYIRNDLNYYSLEVYHEDLNTLKKQIDLVEKQILKNE